jgi:hypothetical protein
MRFRKKRHEKEEEKFNYRPSRLVIISAIFISFVLVFSEAPPILFAISQTMLFLTFIFDVEMQKQKNGEVN